MVSVARSLDASALAERSHSSQSSWWLDILALSLAFVLLFGAFLGDRPLTVPDEGRYAEIPREMVSTGDYLTPRVDGIKYFEKPPFFYWMQSASIKAFGLNEWSIRLPNALMGLLGVLMVYGTGRRLYNRRAGLLAAMCIGTFGLYSAMAHMVTLDMTLSFLISSTLCCFLLGQFQPAGPARSRWMWTMYCFSALATLTKGLIGFLIPGMVVFVWLLLTWQWRELKTYCVPTGFLLLCLIVLPWHILVQIQHPEFFSYYVLDQQFLRYFTDLSQRHQPLWFLPTVLIGGLFPWVGFMIPALINAWPKHRSKKVGVHPLYSTRLIRAKNNAPQTLEISNEESLENTSENFVNPLILNNKIPKSLSAKISFDPINLFLLLWAGLIFIFFWASNSQLIPYVLPVFPPLAILLGRYLDQWLDQPTHWGIYFGLGFSVLLSFALTIVGLLKLDFSQPTLQVSVVLLALTAIIPLLIKWRSTVQNTLLSLSVCASLFFISINFSYPPTDTRSVKSLALTLKPLLQKNDRVYSYQNYYQDLPVYLGRRVSMIDYYGELWHGIEHLEDPTLWLTIDEFWSQWSKPQQQYMILSQSDYEAIPTAHRKQTFEIARNQHNILVSNNPHWKRTK